MAGLRATAAYAWTQIEMKNQCYGRAVMHLIYIDDSRDEEVCVFSVLIIPAGQWRACFEQLRTFRRSLKDSDGIFIRKELHAWSSCPAEVGSARGSSRSTAALRSSKRPCNWQLSFPRPG